MTGFWHKDRNCLAVMLQSDLPSHQKHAENVSKIATASVSIGHLDPVQLVPIFTRVGLMPPVVRMLGDLIPVESKFEAEIRAAMQVDADAGSLYWLEPGGIFFEDIFSERTQVLWVCFQPYALFMPPGAHARAFDASVILSAIRPSTLTGVGP